MNLLEANNIVAGYGEMMVLYGVTISAGESEIVTIIGPNGCGKSTLLKSIMGYLSLKEGQVLLRGESLVHLKPHDRTRKGIGYIPQLDNVFSDLSIDENLEMGAFIADKRKAAKTREVVFEIFPILKTRRTMKAKVLSGGEKQMLALGITLMHEPKIMLLDEPSAGLAPIMAEVLFSKIKEVNDFGTTCVMVEQDAVRALSISNRAYVIAMGQNKIEGSAKGILDNPKIREAYLGGETRKN